MSDPTNGYLSKFVRAERKLKKLKGEIERSQTRRPVRDNTRLVYYDRRVEWLESQLDEALIKVRHLEAENAALAAELAHEREKQYGAARERSWGL